VGYGGTYYANPISLVASYENLRLLEANDFQAYSHLARITRRLGGGIEEVAEELNENIYVNYETGVLSFVFTNQKKISNYRDSINIDWNKYKVIQEKMLRKGFYYHPDSAERIPPSVAHTEEDVDNFIIALEDSIKEYNREY